MDSLKDRIVIIGWGSLIWDLDDLASKVDGDWLMGSGPALPFEFSRVSPKRKQALAVCIDALNGDPCRTNVIVSDKHDIHAAAEDLRARERARDIAFIGAHCPRTGLHRARIDTVGASIADWCRQTGAAGAVWTDLDDNFRAERGIEFSVPNAIAYLQGLKGESFAAAVEYIERAPAATDTPLRRALRDESWWQEAASRLLPQSVQT